MKIQVIELNSKRPLANTKIQLQVKGKDSGFLSLTTDGSGTLTLDDKYSGQQITATNSSSASGQPGQWIPANEGARLIVALAGTKQKTTTTSQDSSSK